MKAAGRQAIWALDPPHPEGHKYVVSSIPDGLSSLIIAHYLGRGETLVFPMVGSPWSGSSEDGADVDYCELEGIQHFDHAGAIEKLGYRPSSQPDSRSYPTEEDHREAQAVGVQPPPT